MIGPLVGDKFAGDEHVIDVDLEGTDPRENDLLPCISIYEQILFILDLWVLH